MKLVAEVAQKAEEEVVVPHVVQLISPPFLGRTVLPAGPAKFGMDLTKHEHGVSPPPPDSISPPTLFPPHAPPRPSRSAAVTHSHSCATAEGQHPESIALHSVWGDRQCPRGPGAHRPGAAGGLHVCRQGSPPAGRRSRRCDLHR